MSKQPIAPGVHFDMRALNRVIADLAEPKHLGIVYSLKCDREARSYIGITKLCYAPKQYESGRSVSRFQDHLRSLRKGSHEVRDLQADWDRYSEPDFEFGILSILEIDPYAWQCDRLLRQAEYEWHQKTLRTYSRPTFSPDQELYELECVYSAFNIEDYGEEY